MHASPDRRSGLLTGQRAAFALLTLLPLALAGCGGGSSDNPALPPPSNSAGGAAVQAQGPAVSVSGSTPQIAGHPVLNELLRKIGTGAGAGCAPLTERDDNQLASFVWKCGSNRVVGASFSLADNRQLALSDLLTGSYAGYLSSTASAQFSAEGMSNTSAGDLSTWYLTPAALVVVFPAGPVSFPTASLTPYLKNPALFG